MSRRDGSSPRFLRESLDEVEGPVTTEEEVDEAAWERSEAVDYAMCLLALQFFSHPQALDASNSLYTIDDDRPVE